MKKLPICLLFVVAIAFVLMLRAPVAEASIADEIAAKNVQIEELQRQIAEYEQQIAANRSKSSTLQNEISKLNARISQIGLEIKSLAVSIEQTGLEIQETQGKIGDIEQKVAAHRQAMGKYIRIMNETDQVTLTSVLLNNDTMSDFFNDVHQVQITQDQLRVSIQEMRILKQDLESRQDDLEGKKSDLERLRGLQEIEKRTLSVNKNEKNQILKITQGEESKFQELVKKSKLDIERLRTQMVYMQQNGVSVEDAVKYGQLAAIAANIRPAFLLAILEIESGLGRNVGTGNWMDDMYKCYQRLAQYYPSKKQYYLNRAEDEKAAFLLIVQQLGLNADTVKVSREPNYGCGGALGPAQFIPTTWLAYEEEVARLTGHNPPSPWNIEDAFTASAIKLARAGATSKERRGEDGAARAYIGGKTTCSSSACNYYANAVLRKAAEIEQNL